MNLLINQTEEYYLRTVPVLDNPFSVEPGCSNSECPKCKAKQADVIFVAKGECVDFMFAKKHHANNDSFALQCRMCSFEWVQLVKEEVLQNDNDS